MESPAEEPPTTSNSSRPHLGPMKGDSSGLRLGRVGALLALVALVAIVAAASLWLTARGDWPDLPHLLPAVLVLSAALLICVVLTFLVAGPGLVDAEHARRVYGTHRYVLGSVFLILLMTLVLAGAMSLSIPQLGLNKIASFVAVAVSSDLVMLGVFYVMAVRPGLSSAKTLGLTMERLPSRLMAGFGAGILLLLVIYGVEIAMARVGVSQTQLLALDWVPLLSLREMALVVVAGGLLAPIAEEIFFRGYVFRSYLDRKGPVQAYFFSALLFSLLHFNSQALLPIFTMALGLALIYHKTGSVVPSIVAHSLNNVLALAGLYAFHNLQ